MDNDRRLVPAPTGPAEAKRTWIAPAVLDMGGMRELTLLQGATSGGLCDPEVPSCT